MRKLLDVVVPEAALYANFRHLLDAPTCAPARDALEDLFRDFVDVDGTFIREFQSQNFDTRLFELFLDCVFRFEGLTRDTRFSSPDFVLSGRGLEFSVEAVTLNPTGMVAIAPANLATVDFGTREADIEQRVNLLPVQIHDSLAKKMAKHYWDLPQVSGRPFVIAIQNFSERFSLAHTDAALMHLLYGVTWTLAKSDGGTLHAVEVPVASHVRNGRSVESNFFGRAESQQLSAVIFCNTGTLSKFSRFAYRRDRARYPGIAHMIRHGACVDHRESAMVPQPFVQYVGEDSSVESWCEGMTVLHNPNATHPLDVRAFPGMRHVVRTNDGVRATTPDFHPLWSHNFNVTSQRYWRDRLPAPSDADLERLLRYSR